MKQQQGILSRWQLERISRTLKHGGVIAYPTESVYGLGCDPYNQKSLQRILDIKGRSPDKGLIILVSKIEQALPFIAVPDVDQLAKFNSREPRATTWLMPIKTGLSRLLCGNHQKLAVRLTSHPIPKAICDYTGQALVSTSCNLQGKTEMKTTSEVRSRMGLKVEQVIAGQCGMQKPSRIVDLLSGQVIRD